MNISILIPAYKPSDVLVELVRRLSEYSFEAIVVVNDGSDATHHQYFEAVRQFRNVHIVRHAVNLGKGAALKSGLNYIACNFQEQIGVVSADADGQHRPTDILRVAEQLELRPNSLVLGCRQFDGPVPFRSRLGNKITRSLVKVLIGHKLTDTQTGLRGIPASIIPDLLRIKANEYEFELDMILQCRNRGIPIRETPIKTIYLDNNSSSHFNPLIDSMKIYFVLLRFAASSMATTILDFAIFTLAYWMSGSVIGSLIAARIVSANFNYVLAKRAVFNSAERYSKTFPKYLVLTLFSGTITYVLIRSINSRMLVGVVFAKACAETLVFFFNFAVQRAFIFASPVNEDSK